MKLISYDENFNVVDLIGIDQHSSISLYHPETKEILVCNWYKFKNADGSASNLKPFVYFCNDGLALFCNDLREANFDSLSQYGKNLFIIYYDELKANGYKNDFERFSLVLTTPEDDDDTSLIRFELGKKLSYFYNDDGTEFTIRNPGEQTHFQLMTGFLRNTFEKRVMAYIKVCIRKMKLGDKVSACYINDPDESNYLNGRHNENDTISVGTFACNYYTFVESQYQTEDYEASYTSVVRYSPFVFFMSAERQKILIVHELVHTKIGSAHQHDAYFWHLVEYYAGLPRTLDFSWDKDQCDDDTRYFDNSGAGTTCAQLIRRHEIWVANHKKGEIF